MDDKLYGRADGKLDAKGRIVLPSKFCPPFAANGPAMLTRHQQFDRCLALWTTSAFEKVELRMEAQLDDGTDDDRFEARYWASDTEKVTFDSQRRLFIPPHLRRFARLQSGEEARVLMVGAINHLEIWDMATFEDEVEQRVERNRAAKAARALDAAAASSPASSAASSGEAPSES